MINLLARKGYISQELFLSEEASKLLEEIETIGASPILVTNQSILNFNEWVGGLLIKLKEKMKELTGSVNAKGYGGKVWFIPSLTDLKSALVRYQKRYKGMFNHDKIEKILLRYVEESASSKDYAPIVQYYIIKEGSPSQLAAAFEDFQEEEVIKETTQQRFI